LLDVEFCRGSIDDTIPKFEVIAGEGVLAQQLHLDLLLIFQVEVFLDLLSECGCTQSTSFRDSQSING
jgi:hypothetical protein